LQPNHFASTTALEAALDEYIAYYNQQAKPINWTYTTEKLAQKLSQKLGANL
jgi:Integrase core domain